MNKLLTEIKQHQCIFYITLIMSFLIAIKVNFLKKFDSKPEPGLFKKIFMDVSAGKEVPHASRIQCAGGDGKMHIHAQYV